MPPTRRSPRKWSTSPPPAPWCPTGRCCPTPRPTRRSGRSWPIRMGPTRTPDGLLRRGPDRAATARLAVLEGEADEGTDPRADAGEDDVDPVFGVADHRVGREQVPERAPVRR